MPTSQLNKVMQHLRVIARSDGEGLPERATIGTVPHLARRGRI